MKKSNLIFHPIFLCSLLLLVLNDFYFKQQFGNYFTGKLSDFTGLVVFPFFWYIVFPRCGKWISLFTAIVFVFWKTPLATPFIDWFNSISFYDIQRTIDYSDYIALVVLPLVHRMIISSREKTFEYSIFLKAGKICILSFGFFAICATSKTYYSCIPDNPEGDVFIGKTYQIKKGRQVIIDSLKLAGTKFEQKTIPACMYDSVTYYQIQNVSVSNPTDSILYVNFYLDSVNDKKTKIEIINVAIKEHKIQKWEYLRSLHRKYKKIVHKTVVKPLKKSNK